MSINTLPSSKEHLSSFGIEKFWQNLHSNLVAHLGVDIDAERVDDQFQKFNVAYRMIKCMLDDINPEKTHVIQKEIINNTYSLLTSIDLTKAETRQEFTEDENNNIKIGFFTDQVLMLFLREANTHLATNLDKDLISEVFSYVLSNKVCKEKNNSHIAESESILFLQESIDIKTDRKINELNKRCKKEFFQARIDSGEITEIQANAQLNKLKLAYGLAKWKFQGIERENEDRYFEHLREVAHIILDESKEPNFEQIIIAFLHDIIEDTNISFQSLEKLFGTDIAFSVHLISKKSCIFYAKKSTNLEDTKKVQNIEKSGILNKNLLISDKIQSQLCHLDFNTKKTEFSSDEIGILMNEGGVKYSQIPALIDYNVLTKKYKSVRNKDYFGHIQNTEIFTEYAKKESTEMNIVLQDLEQSSKNAVQVKKADRLHNLRTLWETGIAKTKRKVEETLSHFHELFLESSDGLGGKCFYEIGAINKKIMASLVYS